ncbi:MAG TPA: hypothetical protein VF173_16830 [Thermoanaerobaculia bacterium]|nr:hypothetical protein [Thermoanaerobaculia bacterium]
MKKLKLFLMAAVLTALAIASAPKTASANMWCDQCASNGDCISCCRCDGFPLVYCTKYACG